MTVHRRLEVSEVGEVTVVRFVDRKILDEANIQKLGEELFHLVEAEGRKSLLLNFTSVDFLSKLERGLNSPSLETLAALVKALSLDPIKLLDVKPWQLSKHDFLFDA